ncbi:gap junction gamma-1 protein-like protein [Lates japonicus]|uniref:Gap junction gamma-1 protein-like protein n=1 Tax=Lates japonicus TaxID=270547 RepID=A0AAD3N0N3_LATJO|nr:gap junction gamma-1 protein-like protein [Lates japonicus]
MSWSFLTRLLEEIHNHSTFMGKIWLTVLIVFRIVLTAVGGESIYYDEQSKFIILVATPSLMYLGYAVNKIARAEERADSGGAGGGFSRRKPKKHYLAARKQHRGIEEAEDDQEEDPMIYEVAEVESDVGGAAKRGSSDGQAKVKARHDGRQRIKEDGLMRIYVLQLLARSSLEVAFLCGQYALYGFSVPPTYMCSDLPCPQRGLLCVATNGGKRSLLIMYAVSSPLALNIWEMFTLGIGTICEIGTPP